MTRKRDMDLIRSLMLEIEEGKTSFDPDFFGDSDEPLEWAKQSLHLELIQEAGLVEFTRYIDGQFVVNRITGKGHDFLDSVRDPAIWGKTKDGAKAAGGFTLDLLGALAKGFLKKQIQDRTGIEVDL